MQKYETSEESGLLRIKAVRSFGDVKEGQRGGLIETENNLSHDGLCWLYEDGKAIELAKVYGDAKVFSGKVSGVAKVFDTATIDDSEVLDYAEVSGNSLVSGDSEVSGHAKVYKNAQVLNKSVIKDYAEVSGNAIVDGSMVSDRAEISDDAKVTDGSDISGSAKILGKTEVSGGLKIEGNEIIEIDGPYEPDTEDEDTEEVSDKPVSQALKDFASGFKQLLFNVDKDQIDDLELLLESSNLTYYELRKFLTILNKINKDPIANRVITSILQTLSALEIRNVKIPTLKRYAKLSKKIFECQQLIEGSRTFK